jgi:hypothetical protein
MPCSQHSGRIGSEPSEPAGWTDGAEGGTVGRTVARRTLEPATASSTPPPARRWRLILGAGCLAAILGSALPGPARDLAFALVVLGAAAATAVPWVQRRSRVPSSTAGLATGLALIGAGAVAGTAIDSAGVNFPSPTGGIQLLGSTILLVALAHLYGHRPSPAGLLDAVILSLAGSLGLWVVLVEPSLGRAEDLGSTAVAVARPLFDLASLGVLVGLLVDPGSRSTSLALALSAVGSLLAADLVGAARILGDTERTGLLGAGRLAGSVLLAAAANHPSLLAGRPAPPAGVEIGRWRFVGLLGAALTAPAVTLLGWATGAHSDATIGALIGAAITVAVFLRLGLAGRALAATIASLEAASARIRHLEGILPICAGCKRIRDDAGRWIPVEHFLADRAAARFSHGLCDECLAERLRELH